MASSSLIDSISNPIKKPFFFRIESLIYQWKKVIKDRDDVNDGSFD